MGDEGDPNDCGQPIKLKCSFQYTIPKDKVTDIYLNFGGLFGLQQRVEIVSRNIISLTAQQFIPSSFNLTQWQKTQSYAEIATALGFNSSQMNSYFKIKALNFQQGNPAGKVVVAVPPPRVEL